MSTHDQHVAAVASWARETPVPLRVGEDGSHGVHHEPGRELVRARLTEPATV